MNLRKELITGILGSVTVFLLTGYYIAAYKTSSQKLTQPVTTQSASGTPAPLSGQSITLTREEVAKHNTPSDCWIIVNQSVYNITNYLAAHPGGAEIIIPFCGADATVAYDTKGGHGAHSSRADQDLMSLTVGNLNQAVNVSASTPKPVQSGYPRGTQRRYDDD